MKYPITPDYIKDAPKPIERLYIALEQNILQSICQRLSMSGETTETALELIRTLQRRGYKLEDIETYIEETLGLSQTALDAMLDDAVLRNQQYFDYAISQKDIVADAVRLSALNDEIAAIRRQTKQELTNLTQSMGFAINVNGKAQFLPIAQAYQRILDDAQIQIWTGVKSPEQTIRDATMQLANSGIQVVDYASGWHNRADVAVRRALITGTKQIATAYSDNLADELETPYREVTAHIGARTGNTSPWSNHHAWQGKVYSMRTGDIYPNIHAVCGLGEVDGLAGANCRHLYYPFIEGVSERTWTDEQLANIDPPPFEYQGRTYDAYSATQKQRQLETAMRNIKRRQIAYESAGLLEDAAMAKVKYNRLKTEYRAFSKAAGLREQVERYSIK